MNVKRLRKSSFFKRLQQIFALEIIENYNTIFIHIVTIVISECIDVYYTTFMLTL